MQATLSHTFSTIVMKRLKEKRPHPFRSIELQDFSLGVSPPTLGPQRTSWSSDSDEQAFYMGFHWETNEMKVTLAATLAGPFKGTARFVINNLLVKGDLRIVPILDGQAFVYSFTSDPEVRVGLAFGGGQSDPATELPSLIASWLEKLFSDTLMRTMVEPQRRVFPLPATTIKKRATGGVISVTVLSAQSLTFMGNFKGQSERRLSGVGSGNLAGGVSTRQMATFVEVTLEGLTRSTRVLEHSGCPTWNESFSMILHESAGTVRFNVYERGSSNVKYDFLGSCEVKVKYVVDGSSIFWTSGIQNRVLADRAENCGKEVIMKVPFQGCGDATLSVKFLVKEWQFADGSKSGGESINGSSLNKSLSLLPSFETHTGRTLKITILEGRHLAAKDRSGKSDPYVRLRYGKLERKTKTVKQDLNPVWKQDFEFPEIGNGEYLQLKCYDADYVNDENLGSARVNLQGLEDGVPKDVWIPLEKISTGDIRILIKASNSESESETSQNGTREESCAMSQQGSLEIVLFEARDLVATDFRGTRDPFVVVHCGIEKQTTKIVHKTLHPQWNETFKLSDTGKPLMLSVKDSNALLPAVNLGHCNVEYERLPMDQRVDKWIPLQGVRKGEIHVQVVRRPAKHGKRGTRHEPSKSQAKLSQKFSKVQALLKQVSTLANKGEVDTVGKKLEAIEMVQAEKSACILQLLREREGLLQKIKSLGDALQNNQGQLD